MSGIAIAFFFALLAGGSFSMLSLKKPQPEDSLKQITEIKPQDKNCDVEKDQEVTKLKKEIAYLQSEIVELNFKEKASVNNNPSVSAKPVEVKSEPKREEKPLVNNSTPLTPAGSGMVITSNAPNKNPGSLVSSTTNKSTEGSSATVATKAAPSKIDIPKSASAKQQEPTYGEYIVQQKNTLFSIARAHGMTVDELKQLNNLGDKGIQPGQKLKVKNPGNVVVGQPATKEIKSEPVAPKPVVQGTPSKTGTYKVQPNNTVFIIAQMHGMTVDELKALNPSLGPDNKIHYGMILNVTKSAGAPVESKSSGNNEVKKEEQPSNISESTPVKSQDKASGEKYTEYKVKTGDSISKIAKEHGMTVEEIMTLNNLNSQELKVLQVIRVKVK